MEATMKYKGSQKAMKILFQTTYGTIIDDEPSLPQEHPRLQKLAYTLCAHMLQCFAFLDTFPFRYENIMFQVKEAFHATTDRRKKLQILTLPSFHQRSEDILCLLHQNGEDKPPTEERLWHVTCSPPLSPLFPKAVL